MDLPTVLYRCPGQWSRPGGTYDYLGVETAENYKAAIAEGWQLTMPAAIEAYETKRDAVIAEVKAESVAANRREPPLSAESEPLAAAIPSIADMQPEADKPRRGRPPKA